MLTVFLLFLQLLQLLIQSDIAVLPFKFSNKDFKVIFTTIKLVRYFSNKDKNKTSLE